MVELLILRTDLAWGFEIGLKYDGEIVVVLVPFSNGILARAFWRIGMKERAFLFITHT